MKLTSVIIPTAILTISVMLGGCNEITASREASDRSTDVRPQTQTIRGAPGPIAGAGLPILAVGGGVYWLVRRRRNANQKSSDANS